MSDTDRNLESIRTRHAGSDAKFASFIGSRTYHAMADLKHKSVIVLGLREGAYSKSFSCEGWVVQYLNARVECIHIDVYYELTEVSLGFHLLKLVQC